MVESLVAAIGGVKMGSYIDREAFKCKYLCCGYLPEMSVAEFEKFPSCDVQPVRHGRWTEGKKNRFLGTKGNYICSNCQSTTGFVKFNYCPNCGAKMDGGVTSERT